MLGGSLSRRVLNADFLRVIREIGYEGAVCRLRRGRNASWSALGRQTLEMRPGREGEGPGHGEEPLSSAPGVHQTSTQGDVHILEAEMHGYREGGLAAQGKTGFRYQKMAMVRV